MAETGPAHEWDERLLQWPCSSLLQSHGWGAVQAQSGWSLERLLVPAAARPLPVSVLVGTGGLPGTSFLYVPRGPACAADDEGTFRSFTVAIRALARSRRALAVEVEPPWELESVPASHPLRRWRSCVSRQPRATVIIDLAPDPEAIRASFHHKTRYNVRVAERKGVSIRAASLDELSACLRATEGRQGIRLPSRRHLAQVQANLGEAAQVLAAVVQDEVVAAIMLVRFGPRVVYLYGGATPRHREAMPNYLLHWRAMMDARAEGCTEYDLWGIPEDDRADHPWHGLAQFKRGFGGRRVRYLGGRRMELVPGAGLLLDVAAGTRRRARRWIRR